MNGPAIEISVLVEPHEAFCDVFERASADGVIDAGEIVWLRRHLRQNGAAITSYTRERQILRTLDRRGLSSPMARRDLIELERDEAYLELAS